MEQCGSLHYLVKRLIKVGNLKQYIRTTGGQKETTRDLAAQTPTTSATPIDENYNFKQKSQRLLRVASVRE